MDGHLQKRRVLFSVCVCVSLEISQLITRTTTNDKQERHQWHWMAVADVPCPKTEGASKQAGRQAGIFFTSPFTCTWCTLSPSAFIPRDNRPSARCTTGFRVNHSHSSRLSPLSEPGLQPHHHHLHFFSCCCCFFGGDRARRRVLLLLLLLSRHILQFG